MTAEYHVFVKPGDATTELTAILDELGLSESEAGVHRTLFVTRANQTVVMVHHSDAPVAPLLRRRGWSEPGTRA